MKTEFYKPPYELIPTALRLLIDDVYHVYYEKLPDELTYRFCTQAKDESHAIDIVKEISRIFRHQSYDHCVYWKVEDMIVVARPEFEYENTYTIDVKFRVRDAG